MTKQTARKYSLAAVIVTVALGLTMSRSGHWLVQDAPVRSDVILVLAGETSGRPARALEMLRQGFGRTMIIDVPANAKIYDFTELELAEKYKQTLPEAAEIEICPIEGLSTRDEARDAEKCLATLPARSVLIVTSDFHTRRALSIFRRGIPWRSFSVAASYDDSQYGQHWWTRRQWAKTFVDERLKWFWWASVDRWR